MTDAEKLEALVRRAVESGYEDKPNFLTQKHIEAERRRVGWYLQERSPTDILFNHDFARALFGDKQYVAYQYHNRLDRKDERLIESGIYPIWKWHLVRAVSHNNPIDYMYKAVFGE